MMGILTFAMGASVGSFLNVVADRLPDGRSLVRPRSFCDSCRRPLGSRELIPVVSYLWLRGRCRHCGASITARVVAVEAAAGLLFLLTYLRYGLGTEFVIISAAASLLLAIAIIDLEHGLILDRIVLPSLLLLLVIAPFWSELVDARPFLGSESLVASLLNSVLAGLGAFLVFLVIAVAFPQGMGLGDVKLAGLIGLLVGFPGVVVALWLAVVTGGLVAMLLIVLRKKGRKDVIPFGPYLALGALAALLAGEEIVSGYQDLASEVAGLWT